MSFFKALGKLALNVGNNAILNHSEKSARAKAYSDTGKQMRKARKNGEWINGSAAFRRNYKTRMKKATKWHEIRKSFINDL